MCFTSSHSRVISAVCKTSQNPDLYCLMDVILWIAAPKMRTPEDLNSLSLKLHHVIQVNCFFNITCYLLLAFSRFISQTWTEAKLDLITTKILKNCTNTSKKHKKKNTLAVLKIILFWFLAHKLYTYTQIIQPSYKSRKCVFYYYKNCNYQLNNICQLKYIKKDHGSLFNDTILILNKFSWNETFCCQ